MHLESVPRLFQGIAVQLTDGQLEAEAILCSTTTGLIRNNGRPKQCLPSEVRAPTCTRLMEANGLDAAIAAQRNPENTYGADSLAIGTSGQPSRRGRRSKQCSGCRERPLTGPNCHHQQPVNGFATVPPCKARRNTLCSGGQFTGKIPAAQAEYWRCTHRHLL